MITMKTTLQHTKQRLLTVFLLLAAMFLISNQVYAAPRNASVSGDWNNTATWGGQAVPTASDACTISTGVTVTIPAAYTATVYSSLAITGTLAIQTASKTYSTAMTINNGGTLKFSGTGNTVTINALNTSGATFNILVDAGASGNAINRITLNQGTLNITNNLAVGSDVLTINATSEISMTGLGSSTTTFNHAGTGKTTLTGNIVKGGANLTQINVNGGTLNVGKVAATGVSIDYSSGNGNAADLVNIASGATLTTNGSILMGTNYTTGGIVNNGTTTIGKNVSGFSSGFTGNGNGPIKNGTTNTSAVLTLEGGLTQTNGGGGISNYGTMTVGVDNTYGASYYNPGSQNAAINNYNTGTLTCTGGIWFGSNTNCYFTNLGTANVGKITQWGSARNCSFYATQSYNVTNGSTPILQPF